MKTFAISWVSSICVMAALAWPQTSSAQVPLVFETTFNCPDWSQFDYFAQSPGALPCPGTIIKQYGGWTVGGDAAQGTGVADQITAAANYPGGGGGKGYRHWRGNGTNINGGGIRIEFPVGHTELWARFYMKYQLGFAWSGGQPGYTKDMYVNVGSPQAWVFGIQGGGGRWGIFNGSVGTPSTQSWASTMGGPTGDGLWHCYEWHIQHGANAQIEIWVDGVSYLNTTITMPAGATTYLALGENQNLVTGAGATPWFTDYDDVAFSTTGRIGCTYGTPVARPPAPQGLTVQ